MSKTYISYEKRVSALPRSKRKRQTAASVTSQKIVPEGVDALWSEETDENDETEVTTGSPIRIGNRLSIVDILGRQVSTISIDENGRFVFDKGIVSKEDIIAYGVGGSDIKSVTDVIEEYLAEHGVGGGGLSSVVVGSSGSGNVVSGMSKTLSDDGKTLTLTLTKGISAYVKPSTGIPLTDLASSVQASLEKADTALQEHQSLQGYATEQWVEDKGYLTEHQNISGKADKSSTVSTIAYDSTNKKITKTINGTTSNVVTVATLKSAMDAVTSTDLGNAIAGEVQARTNAINALQTALDGKRNNTAPKSGAWFAGTPQIGSDGVMEIGRYIDFHPSSASTLDFGCRLDAGNSTTGHVLTLPNKTGTLAITTDNVASATKLQTARTLWGNSFDGSANIDGTITMGEGTDGRTVKLTNSDIKFIATSQSGWAMNLVARNHADSSTLATLIGGYGNADTYNYTYLGGTYNNPNMVILPNGNIGIGTTNPTSKLRVIGSAQIDGLNLNNCSLSDTGNIAPKSTNTKNIGSSTLLYASVYANAFSANADELYITNTKSQKDIGFWINNGTNNTQRMLIRGSDGAVGIGSSSPSYRLHVAGGSVYSDTAIRVPNSKPFASKLADGTDINLLSINANNKVNVGNASYLTDVNGSTIQLYNSSTEKVIIGSGNIATEVAATTERYVRVKNSNGEVKLSTSTNRGLYDTTNSKWIACYNNATSRTELLDGKVYIGSRILTPAATSISDGGGIEVGNNKILSLANNLIFCADGLRFSNTGTNWYYNNWAGLKYDSTNKIIYLGVADGTVFTSNTPAITGGTIQTVNSRLSVKTADWDGLVINRANSSGGAWIRFNPANQSTTMFYCGASSNKTEFDVFYNTTNDEKKVMSVDLNGNLVAVGDVTAYSDKRLKSDIKDLEYRGPLEPKTYIKDGKKSIGFIAQEVRELYPELVLGEEKEDEYLSLNYGAITAVLAAENKELRKRIERFEALLNKLIEK